MCGTLESVCAGIAGVDSLQAVARRFEQDVFAPPTYARGFFVGGGGCSQASSKTRSSVFAVCTPHTSLCAHAFVLFMLCIVLLQRSAVYLFTQALWSTRACTVLCSAHAAECVVFECVLPSLKCQGVDPSVFLYWQSVPLVSQNSFIMLCVSAHCRVFVVCVLQFTSAVCSLFQQCGLLA